LGDLLREFFEGEAGMRYGSGVIAILAALEDGHGKDGVEVCEGGEGRAAGVEELDAWVAIGFAGLREAPAVDIDGNDGGVGKVFGEGEGFFSGGAAEGEDGGRGDVFEMACAGDEEVGVAIRFGEGCALEVVVAID
jgi:hypothetical protein